MFSYFGSLWGSSAEQETPAEQYCWMIRGGGAEHSAKCHLAVNGFAGVFDSLEKAQTEVTWLALYTGCAHLRILKMPLNKVCGKPSLTHAFKELKYLDNDTFQAIFVGDAPEVPAAEGPILTVSTLKEWCEAAKPESQKKLDRRLVQIKTQLDAGEWQRWSLGANDAILMPRESKQKTE